MKAIVTKKDPIIHTRSQYLPYPSGNCKMCGKNYQAVTIQLEHGGYIIVPANVVQARDNDDSLVSLFWEEP